MKEHVYFVKGMHCASCELLIEKRLLELKQIKSADASTSKGEVLVEYEGGKPTVEELNKIFKENGYIFSDKQSPTEDNSKVKNLLMIFGVSILLIFGFISLQRSGFSSLIQVNSKSALPTFFVFGLLAGVSSCAALVGGMILSMSKQWEQKFQPHILFNTGRLISYAFFGAILGIIGERLRFSLTFSSVLVLAVSVMMIFLAFQMFGFKAFRRFQITMPKFMVRKVVEGSGPQNSFMPFLLGAFTFFLPCGFTLTAQGLALLSGSAVYGGLIMFLFALGTLTPLLLIGFSSVKLLKNPHLSDKFLKIAAILVLFFALYNINSQFNILGLPSLNNLSVQPTNKLQTSGNNNTQLEGLPPIIDGKQVVKMQASSRGYQPDYLKVQVNVPVRWEIEDVGTSGCTNAIISRSLFDGEIPLTPGQTSIKEFTPTKVGKYKFSCWMGMVSGVIEVINPDSSTNVSTTALNNSNGNNDVIVPSGAKGCGCGGGGGNGSCGARN